MIRWLTIGLCLSFVLSATPSAQAEDGKRRTEIHLITMGPGLPLFTRAGHLSLMVATLEGDKPVATRVYNYGDTNWQDPWLVANFFRGKLDFFLSVSGTLKQTVQLYGRGQGRAIHRQKINFSDAQAEQVAKKLALEARPENRSYRYHHIEQICTTRARDLIDETTGGAVRAQLEKKMSDKTVYDDVAWAFSGHPYAVVAADLFFGRAHHRERDLFSSLYEPGRMSRALATVQVPDPRGGDNKTVALLGPRHPLAERVGPPLITAPSKASTGFAVLLAILLFALGFDARKRLPKSTRYVGAFVGVGGAVFGVIGLLILLLWLLSGVAEFGANEFAMVFLATDLLLVPPARRWWREKGAMPSWMMRYAYGRLALVALATLLALSGVFVQRPIAYPLLSLGFSVGLLILMRSASSSSSAEPSAG
jgi:hypothetical protein